MDLTFLMSLRSPEEAKSIITKATRGRKAPKAGHWKDGKAAIGAPVFIR